MIRGGGTLFKGEISPSTLFLLPLGYLYNYAQEFYIYPQLPRMVLQLILTLDMVKYGWDLSVVVSELLGYWTVLQACSEKLGLVNTDKMLEHHVVS